MDKRALSVAMKMLARLYSCSSTVQPQFASIPTGSEAVAKARGTSSGAVTEWPYAKFAG